MTKDTLVAALNIILDLPKDNKDLHKLPVKTLQQMFDGLNKNLVYLADLEKEVGNLRYQVGVQK